MAGAIGFICITCGVQHAPSEIPPERCAICEDERQYVGDGGQRWTTLAEMRGRYRNTFMELEPDLVSIRTMPGFAIGQHALLVRTRAGNVLWDCLSYLDDETVARVRELGGIAAIAISHPHFYDSCVEWSSAFGDAPIYLPAVDREWVMRPSPSIVHLEGDQVEPVPGVRVIRVGGHFHGSTVLHWAAGAEGRGALLTGDSLSVVADRRFVTVMYSYPNRIPLSAGAVRDVGVRALRHPFDRLYGGWRGDVIEHEAMQAVRASVERYAGMVEGSWPRR
ncbi:MAG TPA: MBL fold metallo-hydrolase [Actinomycetota bacterium]|nr:MBL fold metallo-hydrolase [Actinomycetota bacterium]